VLALVFAYRAIGKLERRAAAQAASLA
jgi:hypothetical protein